MISQSLHPLVGKRSMDRGSDDTYGVTPSSRANAQRSGNSTLLRSILKE